MVNIFDLIKRFQKELPAFPDGRIDYSFSSEAPIVSVFVQYEDWILLLKRSDKVSSYQGKWNNIGGYIDELKPLEQKAFEEMHEETGIGMSDMAGLAYTEPDIVEDKSIGKTWIKFVVKVVLKRQPEIKLDFEHTDYKWVREEEISSFDSVPGLLDGWNKVKDLPV